MTAWETVSATTAKASPTRDERRGARLQAASSAPTAMATTTAPKSRLPNSMTPWRPISGVVTSDCSVHLGHSAQPRPDSVRRTAPPVTMMTTLATRLTSAHPRTAPGWTNHLCNRFTAPNVSGPGRAAALPVPQCGLRRRRRGR